MGIMLLPVLRHFITLNLCLFLLINTAVAYAPVESRVYVDMDSAWEITPDSEQQQSSQQAQLEAVQPEKNQLAPTQQYIATAVTKQQPAYLDRLAQLEKEVRELRGQLEEQNHLVKQMKSLQQQLFSDIDRRLSSLAGGMDSKQNRIKSGAPLARSVRASKSIQPSKKQNNSNSSAEERIKYQTAYNLLRDRQYVQAKKSMITYLKDYPDGKYAVNAHYWLGELSLITGDNKMAAEQFNAVIAQFPSSGKVPDAMLKIGMIYLENGNQQAAKTQFEKIVTVFPDSAPASLAQKRLQTL